MEPSWAQVGPDRCAQTLMRSYTGPASGGPMSKREPQIILKSHEGTIVLELGLEGKFTAKSSGWDENRVLLEGDHLDIVVKHGRWVVTHVPAKPRPPAKPQHYFPTDKVAPQHYANRVSVAPSHPLSPAIPPRGGSPRAVEADDHVVDEESALARSASSRTSG
jgi:hypothetical protein